MIQVDLYELSKFDSIFRELLVAKDEFPQTTFDKWNFDFPENNRNFRPWRLSERFLTFPKRHFILRQPEADQNLTIKQFHKLC